MKNKVKKIKNVCVNSECRYEVDLDVSNDKVLNRGGQCPYCLGFMNMVVIEREEDSEGIRQANKMKNSL